MGQNWGAQRMDRIKQGLRSAVMLAVSFAVIIAALMLLFGKTILMLVILYLLHMYRSAIQGMSNTIIPMISGFLEYAGRVSVAFFMSKIVGETGLFWAESAAWLFSAVFYSVWH